MRTDTRALRLLGGMLLVGLLASSASASASATTYEATTGTAQIARGASLAAQGPATPALPRGARRRHAGATTEAAVAAGGLVPPSSFGVSAGLLENFNGVSSHDSEITNFGEEFEPPDQGLCSGNGFVVEMVNSAYSVYRTDGTLVAGPFNVNDAFDEGSTEFTSDPRCQYEAATHTWYAEILQLGRGSTSSQLDIAVNTSGDPTRPWTPYRIPTSGEGGASGPHHPGCPCFGDEPLLGFDSHNMYISTNEFSILGPQFYGANIYAISKKDLLASVESPHVAVFYGLKLAGSLAASIQPALSNGAPPAEYFLSNNDPTETSGNSIGVWALTEAAAVERGRKPKLSSVLIGSEPYAIPLGAEQKGTSSLLVANDDRMQQTAYTGGTLWGELSTSLNVPGDPVQRDGAAWFEVKPTLTGNALSGATLEKQGYLAVPGNYLLYPAIAPTSTGSAVMVMTISGASRFPSAAYARMASGAANFGAVTVAAKGTTNYDPTAERWGDYSWAVLDPNGENAWLATEYVPPKASQTTDGLHNWGTRVLEVREP